MPIEYPHSYISHSSLKIAKALLIITLASLMPLDSYSQEKKKIYYTEDWIVTENKDEADYYRIVTVDSDGQPIGKVKDYYISGELQWEGYFSYMHPTDNNKDIQDGRNIFYYKNGNKQQELTYSQGTVDGEVREYYQSGNLFRKSTYRDGEMVGKWYLECDELGACEDVFYEGFSSRKNKNEWPLSVRDGYYEASIIPETGYKMESTEEGGFKQTIYLPIEPNKDFSISAITEFINGGGSPFGIIWGFKDWDNYFFFGISSDGYYRIDAITEGINLEIAEWTESEAINKGQEKNWLKIVKLDNKIYFSINRELVNSTDFLPYRGNEVGYYVGNSQDVLFKALEVRKESISERNSVERQEISESWKGNGTGFFISNEGYIATNYHVVKDANEIEIVYKSNGKENSFPARVIQSDIQNDISILKVDKEEYKLNKDIPYSISSNTLDTGSEIFALGYPMALSVMGTEIKFTDGKISSKTGYKGDVSSYQISVPIQPGNSGGPLFDLNGNLVGITSSALRKDIADNVGYALKASYLKNLIDILPANIKLPKSNLNASIPLTERIKAISDYVVLIKVK